VIAPVLYQLTAPQAENLRQFVEQGGTLVMTYFSGIVDDYEHVWLGGYPALLQDVLGLKVEEWQPLPRGTKNSLVLKGSSKGFACDFFTEVVRPAGAEVLATFESDLVAGHPAITRHSFGKGEAIYLATKPDAAFLTAFLREVLAAKGIVSPVDAAEGVEATIRATGGEEYLFVINHTGANAAVAYNDWAGCTDLLAGCTAPSSETMSPFAVRILCRTRG
jgi:beta-galactosidase